MRRTTVLVGLTLALVLPTMVTAEVFIVQLDNGTNLKTRYQPRIVPGHEDKVMLVTDTGNWISLPADSVVKVESETALRGFGQVLNTTTISLGFAPNEADPLEGGNQASDSATALLNYLQGQDSSRQDYSVQQFVDTESAGAGGFSSGSFNTGTNSGFAGGGLGPQQYVVPGSVTGSGFTVGNAGGGAVEPDVQ